MKKLKKNLMLFAFIFVSANVSANVNIDELAKEMGNSKELIQFMKNKLILKIYQSCKIEYKFNSEEFENKCVKLINDNILLEQKIHETFSDFYNLSKSDKEKVIEKVFETSYSWANYWSCMASKITTSAFVVSITVGATISQKRVFNRCWWFAFAADVAELAASDGTAVTVLAEEFVGEAKFCKWLAGCTGVVYTAEITAMLTSVFSCSAAD